MLVGFIISVTKSNSMANTNCCRDPTPPMSNGEGLSTIEELVHLRRQIVKMNRRVTAIETEQMQRQQKEKIAYAIGIAYLLFKVIAWLNRS